MEIVLEKNQINAISKIDIHDPSKNLYIRDGKVRKVVYFPEGDKIALVTGDDISAFDHILPKPIPHKGQVLNFIASHILNAVKERTDVPVWYEKSFGPNISVGKRCEPIKLEMVIRGYLLGHAWREYKSGKREICGVPMPDGMKEGDKFPNPIITPATKAEEGEHDEDISAIDILEHGIVSRSQWEILCDHTRTLFELGTDMAVEQGLILADTKYEFGLYEGEITLIDEIHTPDSSRYMIAAGYRNRQAQDIKQEQLSKEFVREWLMDKGFQGKDGQVMPDMPDSFVHEVSAKYIELAKKITGKEMMLDNMTEEHVRRALYFIFPTEEVSKVEKDHLLRNTLD